MMKITTVWNSFLMGRRNVLSIKSSLLLDTVQWITFDNIKFDIRDKMITQIHKINDNVYRCDVYLDTP